MAPKHLPVFFLNAILLLMTITTSVPISSSYAQIQQESKPQSTPLPASLDVTVLYPSDGILKLGQSQLVRANITIGPPPGVPAHNYRLVTTIHNAVGNVVRSHSYHPAHTQSVGNVTMRGLSPGDYTFSVELYSGTTMVAQSRSSKITKKGKPIPTPTVTATPTGTPTPSSVPGYATTWLGNTFRGGMYADMTTPDKMHMQQSAMDMTVESNGLVMVNTKWDEGHMDLGMYQNGQIVGLAACGGASIGNSSSGWNGASITNNGTYVFATVNSGYASNAQMGAYTNFIGRWNLNGTAAGGFSGATGSCTNYQTVDASPNGTDWLYGIAASSTEVFVTDGATNQIKVYDINLQFKRSWSFSNPRRVAYDPSTGTLWISQGTTIRPNQVFRGNIYNQSITGVDQNHTITTVTKPTSLTMHNDGASGWHLYVADDGPDQQIKIFNTSGVQTGTFGVQGGYLANTEGGPGVIAADKLIRPNGIGFDSSNNIYVLGGAASLDAQTQGYAGGYWALTWSTDLREYDSAGTLLWEISAPGGFDDVAVPDATTDGQDFYSLTNHYKFDYNKLTTGSGGGGQEWSWYSSTMDLIDYPHDPRQYQYFPNARGVQTIGGNKYLATTDQYGHNLLLFHMVNPTTGAPGEIAKPMTVFSSTWLNVAPAWPTAPSNNFLWQDTNNDGEPDGSDSDVTASMLNNVDKWWQFDTNGDVWVAGLGSDGIGRFPMQGMNGNSQLTYTTGSYISYGIPAPFTDVHAMQYDRANDVMYVSGHSAAIPAFTGTCTTPYGALPCENEGQSAGSVLARYNNWLAGNRSAAWTINLPHALPSGSQVYPLYMATWQMAGSKIFAAAMMTPDNTEGGSVPVQNIWVYDIADGSLLGEMVPGDETNNYMGWIDQNQGFAAFQRSNGEYIVTEEEQKGAKVTILRGLLQTYTSY